MTSSGWIGTSLPGPKRLERRSSHERYPVQAAVLATQAMCLGEDVALGHPRTDLRRERAEDVPQDRRCLTQSLISSSLFTPRIASNRSVASSKLA